MTGISFLSTIWLSGLKNELESRCFAMYELCFIVVYILSWYDARTDLRMKKRKQAKLAKSMRACEKRIAKAQKNLCYMLAEKEKNEYERLIKEYIAA